MYVLVKMSFDYSDEFDVDSFLVIKKEEWESIYSNIKKLLPEYPTQEFKDWKDRRDYEVKNSIEDIECYFGTNEQVMFKYIDDFNNGIKIHSITEDQAKFLYSIFGKSYSRIEENGYKCSFGTGDNIINILCDKLYDKEVEE